ncbi:MAG: hydrogenase maturation nickel metallochaperone HypA [Candidatus Omnitrophica bacterium]|nr:hydrogenase maturation nickel metallochaperone HypA [Candidatus Omnitrophota bacterium]
MHEFSIVKDLIEMVEKEAAAAGANRVTQVTLRFNPLAGFVAEHIEFSFELAKAPSALLAQAELKVNSTKGMVRCLDCGHEFEVEELPNICPHCDSLRLEPLDQVGLVIESYEIER